MQSIPELPELRARPWREVVREQGRTLTWLAAATNKSYPIVTAYAKRHVIAPQEWLDQVSALLGERVR